jgi:hypothetical protein
MGSQALSADNVTCAIIRRLLLEGHILPILGIIGLLALSPTLVRLLRSGVKQRRVRE